MDAHDEEDIAALKRLERAIVAKRELFEERFPETYKQSAEIPIDAPITAPDNCPEAEQLGLEIGSLLIRAKAIVLRLSQKGVEL